MINHAFLTGLALTLITIRAEAVIFFSEAYPNPCGPPEGVNGLTGGLEGREWFEITNPDATDFSMNGLTIADNTSSTSNRFRVAGLSIPAGGSVVFSGLSLTDFNSIFGTALTTLQYYEIPATPTWNSGNNNGSGMTNDGWLNNGAGDNLRIFTDQAGTTELSGSYRPAANFPGTTGGQSFYWDGSSASWTLNATGGTPAGFEGNDPACPHFSSPGVAGAAVPEPGAPLLILTWLLGAGLRRKRTLR